jgi:glycosyltransferase involved in cell wall biosynthesis
VIDELIVISHLRWDFVWQRPQHIVSRLAQNFDRVTVVEEPRASTEVVAPFIATAEAEGITRVWLEVSGDGSHCGFDDERAKCYPQLLREFFRTPSRKIAWLYTPLGLPLATPLEPSLVVYDVMDDLSKFAHASPLLVAMQQRCLQVADHVFTGGRSLQRMVAQERPDARCFPSGVELEHFSPAIELRRRRSSTRPIAGYVGVIDERVDLDLVAGVADALPDWDVCMVGPVVKIDPAHLPQAPNLVYTGARQYSELPHVLAGFDVAMMPFALNDATRSISPTKSLEYLAAGLPVVSTRIPDVVADLEHVVSLADDSRSFADACRAALGTRDSERERACRSLLRWHQWDTIADRMSKTIVDRSSSSNTAVGS